MAEWPSRGGPSATLATNDPQRRNRGLGEERGVVKNVAATSDVFNSTDPHRSVDEPFSASMWSLGLHLIAQMKNGL